MRSCSIRIMMQGHQQLNKWQNITPKAAVAWTERDVVAILAYISTQLSLQLQS